MILNIFATGMTGSIGKNLQGVKSLRLKFPCDVEAIQETLEELGCSTLIHLAAMTAISRVEKEVALSNSINVEAPIALLQAFINSGGKRFIFASTGHVYGPQQVGHFSVESDMPNPQTLYSDQKLRAENALIEIANSNDVDLVILRIFSVFGPSMANHYLAGMVSKQNIISTTFPMISNSEDVRDFSNPVWVARKIEEFCHLELSGVMICNIASSTPMSIRERVLQARPEWPQECFDGGQSNMSWLVGSNCLLEALLPDSKL
jgi:nucleoside-diphosphate-sugar epimerase